MAVEHATLTGTGKSGAAGESDGRVNVLLPLPLAGAYDYAQPEGDAVAPGDFVRVPFGRRMATGVVWGEGPADPENKVGNNRLKAVAARLPVPAMPEATRRFIEWVAAYTVSDPGSVLRMAMSVRSALEPPRPVTAYRLAGPPPDRMTAARGRVIDVLAGGPPLPSGELAREAGVSPGVIRGLVEAGTLAEVLLTAETPVDVPQWDRQGRELSPAQTAAAEDLRHAVAADAFSVNLLDGVTGAGKTEVYFEAVAAALQRGRQVCVLVPEISLTAQWLRRFADRFAAEPVEWHSDLGQATRRRNWRAVADGSASVVVGARSALFLPYRDLGLIVVDEEHDQAFKQEDGVAYNARDMSVVRASLGRFPAVLVSATPSLESLVNVESGRYRHVHLPDRVGEAVLPEISAIDLRADPPPRGQWISPTLRAGLLDTLDDGGQSMLFLNRRGYAPLTLCRTCGHRLECPNCSTWLVEHRFRGRLQCHHCGHSARLPEACPECESENSFAACGPGVERLLEEVRELLPEARVLIMSSDTVRGPAAAAEMIDLIAAREVDLVIGTQIVAKGHHFPDLTLVGVVDADLGLNGGDLRAAERTFQLLSQVAGRAGRAERPGRAMLQTYMPEHPVMQALISGDRDSFMQAEMTARRDQGMPPFGRLVALIVSGPDEAVVSATASELGRKAPRMDRVQVFGPAPAPLSLLRGRFRYRLLMKTAREVNASDVARRWLAQVDAPNNVRIAVDVDPYSFM